MVETFDGLMRALAREAGLKDDFEAASPLEFTIGDTAVVISLDRRGDADDIVLHSRLGIVPEARELDVYRVLLEANVMWSATGDATLGVNSATREALICYRYALKDLDAGAFAGLVGAFAELARNWRAFLAAAEEELARPGASAPLIGLRV
jgi:hypothetical protein